MLPLPGGVAKAQMVSSEGRGAVRFKFRGLR